MSNDKTLEIHWKKHQNAMSKNNLRIGNFLRNQFHRLKIPELIFKLFERYLKPISSDQSQVVQLKNLTPDSIQGLIAKNNICAIHISNFCSPEVAESLSRCAEEEYTHWKLGGVISTDMFYAGGSIPFEVAQNSRQDFFSYFNKRNEFISKQRNMSEGKWPVDKVRIQLDESWPFGACLGNYMGEKLRPAIMRIINEKNEINMSAPEKGFIHTDDFPDLKPSKGTFTANIYLKIPDQGGELYIWSINLKRIKGFINYLNAKIITMMIAQNYIFNNTWQQKISKLLPEPVIIKPKVGDLVIFHSGRPHSVAPVKNGVRVTNQLFIYAKGNVPLVVGS